MVENLVLYLVAVILFLTLLVGFYLIIRAVNSNVIVTDEPDYVGRFNELGADALLEVMEKRKAIVEEAVLEDLPLDEIKQQNIDIIAKFEELDRLTREFRDDNEATRTTTRGLQTALSVGIGERGNWGRRYAAFRV